MEHDGSEQQKKIDARQAHSPGDGDAVGREFPDVMAKLGLGKTARPSENLEEMLFTLDDPEWSVRAETLRKLGKLGTKAPVEALSAALKDEHEAVRSAAVRALGNLGRRAPLEELQAMLYDSSWHVRTASIMALGKQRERVSREPFVYALHDSDESVRAAAAWALGKQGEHTPLAPLVLALHDPSWSVREAAVLALGERGGDDIIGPLLAARGDEDSAVRAAVEQALQQVYPTSAMTGDQNGTATTIASRDATLQPLARMEPDGRIDMQSVQEDEEVSALDDIATERQHNRREKIRPFRRGIRFSRALAEPDDEQMPPPRKKARHPARRIAGQVLAAAVLIGIIISWASISHLLRPTSGQIVSTASLTLNTRAVNGAAWSRDGRYIATAENSVLWLWDVTKDAQQTPREIPLAPNSRVLSLNWSTQNLQAILMVNGQLELVRIADGSTGASIALPRLNAQSEPLVAWSSNGQHFAIAARGGDGRIEFCDISVHCQAPVFLDRLVGNITALALTSDGSEVAIASDDSNSSDKNVQVWNSQGKLSGLFTNATYRLSMASPIIALAWSAQNNQLAYESKQQQLAVWNRSSGNNTNNNLNTPSQAAAIDTATLAWSPDGQRLASVANGRQVQIWDVVSGSLLYTSAQQKGAVIVAAWSPDGKHLAITSADGMLTIWSIS